MPPSQSHRQGVSMLNDTQLRDEVRRCGGPYPAEKVSAEFIRSLSVQCMWRMTYDGICFMFPDYFREAPLSVIRDITKRMIQMACYSSDAQLSHETKQWMITGLNSPENIRTYCQRNGFEELEQFNDCIVVTSRGDVVSTSIYFRTIAIPRKFIGTEKKDEMIAEAYSRIVSGIDYFMEEA